MSSSSTSALWRSRPWLLAGVVALILLLSYAFAPLVLGKRVRTFEVSKSELVQTVVSSGRVMNAQRVEIGSQITGTVAQIPVAEGQTVMAGQTLIVLETAELQAAVQQARFAVSQSETRVRQIRQVALPSAQQSLRQAEASLLDMQQQFRRTKELNKTGYVGKAQLDDAQKNLDIAESQVRSARLQVEDNLPGGSATRLGEMALQQARAGLQVATANLEHGTIHAPVAGVLITRSVERGDVAQPGKVLMVLSPASETQLVVQIDEKNLGLLALGQKALASPDAYLDRKFPAELVYINPAVDPQRGSVEVKLRVTAPPDYLRQDMTVSVDIETARHPDALTLPAEVVQDLSSTKPWVMKIDAGRAHRLPVRIGARASRVEILEGLSAGDRVISLNGVSIAEGDRVRSDLVKESLAASVRP